MQRQYLGYGLGIGATLNENCQFDRIVYNDYSIEFSEVDQPGLKEDAPSRISDYTIGVEPGRLSTLWNLQYRFSNDIGARTVEVDFREQHVSILFEKLARPTQFKFASASQIRAERNIVLICSNTLRSPVLFKLQLFDKDKNPKDIDVRSQHVCFEATDGCELIIAAAATSPFDEAFVVAATYEMAASASSSYHAIDKYLPVILAENGLISAELRSQINRQLDYAGSKYLVLVGIDDKSVEDLLWDKSDRFRSCSRIFKTLNALYDAPELGEIEILRCPSKYLPEGLLHARRNRLRLMLDNEATNLEFVARSDRKHLVSYEGVGHSAIIASNFAFYSNADLINVGPVDDAARATYGDHVSAIQRYVIDGDLGLAAGRVEELKEFLRNTVPLPVVGKQGLTAFTHGFSYSVPYSLPVGHIPEDRCEATILFDIFNRERASARFPMALLVSTDDFPHNEFSGNLADLSERFICSVLEGVSSQKLSFLRLMQILSPSLTFIVAHGGVEIFYRDTFEITDDVVVQKVEVNNSNRELPDFHAAGVTIDARTKVERVDRQVVATGSDISGIQLNDALVTPKDVSDFFRAPVAWGIIINNGCGTWTSLGSAFVNTGSSGYVGTLWPVGENDAFYVGAALLRSRVNNPIASLISSIAADRGELVRANYVCVGSVFSAISEPPAAQPETKSIFIAVARAEAHFQEVIQQCPAFMIGWLANGIAECRDIFFQLLLSKDANCAPLLWFWRGTYEAIVEGRSGFSGEAIQCFEAALASLEAVAGNDDHYAVRFRVTILIVMSQTYCKFGKITEARTAIEDARGIAERCGVPETDLIVTAAALTLAEMIGDNNTSRAELERMRRLMAETGKDTSILPADINTAHSASARPQYSFEELSRARNLGLRRSEVADMLFSLGEAYRDAGLLDKAAAAYERCIEIYREMNAQSSLAMTYNNLGIIYRAKHDTQRARELFNRSLNIKQTVHGRGIGNTLMHLSDLSDDGFEALALLDDALTHAQQDGDHKCVAEALICKGRRLTASGAASEAIPLLQQASTIADKLGRIPLAACAQIEIGIALLKLDSPIEGLQLISSGHQALAQQGLFTTEFHRAQNIVETMEWVFSGKNKFAIQDNFDGCVSLLGPDIVRKLLRFLFSECIQANSVAAAQRIYDLDKSAFSEQDRVALLSPLERGRWLAATAGSLPAEGVPTEKTIDAAENHRANAVTYRGAGMWSEAVAEFEKALEIYRELGDADAAANICGDIGSCLIEVNRFADAEHFFKDALTLSSPTSFDQVARLRNNLGFLYQRMGRAAEARRQYELCLEACRTFEANPVAVLAYVNIGELSMTIGEYDPAAAAFRKVIALTETISADEHRERMRLWGISAHINLASILNAQEQDLDTLKAIRDGVGRIVDAGLKELTLQIWQGVGNLSEQLSDGFSGLFKECLEVASTECTDEGAGLVFALYCCACGLLENDERAILDAMHVVRANGRAELAVRVCEYLLSENPAARRTHLVLASCLSDSGKKHAALAELEWCIASDPKDPIAYNNKANELYALGRYEETILAADIAIKIHPMYLSAIEVRAFALCCIGDTEAAQNAFLKIAEADPRSSRGAMARQLHQLLTSLPRNKFLATWEKIKSSASPR